MEKWSLQDLTDVSFRQRLDKVICDKKGLVHMEFSDGVIEASIRQAYLNLFWLQIPHAFGIPLRKDHFIKRVEPTTGNFTGAWSKYYDEIMGQDFHHAKKLKQVVWSVIQTMHDVSCTYLLPYSRSLDIMDIADIMLDPKMKPILDEKNLIKPEMGTKVIETFIDAHNDKIMSLMNKKEDGLKCDALLPFRRVEQLNRMQIPQTIFAFGVRTDVNDTIIRLPVVGSALSGLRNIQEFAVESLSAKKSLFYNHVAVADSQYFGRKQHLLGSSLHRIIPGDCGSKLLVPFKVPLKKFKNVIGKLVVVDGKYVTLDRNNIGKYAGQTVMMRSPITCKYRTGVCEVCGGSVFRNLNRKLNPGVLSASEIISRVSQKILSAKHLIKTNTIAYELPSAATKYLYKSSTDEIRWSANMTDKLANSSLGIEVEDFPGYTDIWLLKSDRPTKEEQRSMLHQFTLRNDKTGKTTTVGLAVSDGEDKLQVPHFSSEMLFYIRDHLAEVRPDDGKIWIPLNGTQKFPIFRTHIVNDNMLMFVKRVSGFLSKVIKDYTSASEALQDFADIIYDKVDVNIVYIETLLKAYMISSDTDYRIPEVTDIENVKFQTNPNILTNRHIGLWLAFQGLDRGLSQPSTYLQAKSSNPMDLIAGYI